MVASTGPANRETPCVLGQSQICDLEVPVAQALPTTAAAVEPAGAVPAPTAFRPARSRWKKVFQDGIQWLLAVRPLCQNRKPLVGSSICTDRREAGGAFAPPGPPGKTMSNQMRSDGQQV